MVQNRRSRSYDPMALHVKRGERFIRFEGSISITTQTIPAQGLGPPIFGLPSLLTGGALTLLGFDVSFNTLVDTWRMIFSLKRHQ